MGIQHETSKVCVQTFNCDIHKSYGEYPFHNQLLSQLPQRVRSNPFNVRMYSIHNSTKTRVSAMIYSFQSGCPYPKVFYFLSWLSKQTN